MLCFFVTIKDIRYFDYLNFWFSFMMLVILLYLLLHFLKVLFTPWRWVSMVVRFIGVQDFFYQTEFCRRALVFIIKSNFLQPSHGLSIVNDFLGLEYLLFFKINSNLFLLHYILFYINRSLFYFYLWWFLFNRYYYFWHLFWLFWFFLLFNFF